MPAAVAAMRARASAIEQRYAVLYMRIYAYERRAYCASADEKILRRCQQSETERRECVAQAMRGTFLLLLYAEIWRYML